MNVFITLSIISVASALTSIEVNSAISQSPLLSNACPAYAVVSNGECKPSSTDNTSFHSNSSRTLAESDESVEDIENIHWSFRPECFSNEKLEEPLCVFSDQSFASGRGIFLVTTSVKAHQMLAKPAFSKPNALERMNRHENPSFELREFPGKGRGAVANKTLHRGDQIFASTPLLLTDPKTHELLDEERLTLAHRGVKTLPSASQALFWGLLDHFKGDPVDDRINTNAFEVEVDGHVQYAILPEIAMMNHDCRPNAAYFWDEETLSHQVHATETIYPGQEITITYINNEKSRLKRMANLEHNWGFKCGCSTCSAHPAFVEESNARLKQMSSIARKLDDWTSASIATPQMAEVLIGLYKQERLFAGLGQPYKQAAEAYSSVGDKWNAIKYARLSAEYIMLDRGFRDKDVIKMRAMAQQPEMSWSWKKRMGMQSTGSCGHVH